jgi:hypothetical protein
MRNAEATHGALIDKPEVKKAKKSTTAMDSADNMGVDETEDGKLVGDLEYMPVRLSSLLNILTLSSLHR